MKVHQHLHILELINLKTGHTYPAVIAKLPPRYKRSKISFTADDVSRASKSIKDPITFHPKSIYLLIGPDRYHISKIMPIAGIYHSFDYVVSMLKDNHRRVEMQTDMFL